MHTTTQAIEKHEHVDVAIIGAGPSGAVAAALLQRAGRNVLVLERQHFPRFSIGESLLPQSMAYLEAAGRRVGTGHYWPIPP
jgi:2-polyprenyl-6-methoxyphenol hydroxylase-like FAD-dependent oxidoreductase